MQESQKRAEYTLVARKPSFGLPTGCPICLPLFIYLKFSYFPFHLVFNNTFPDSDQIPYIESGTYVAYNDENGGVIKILKEDGIVDLDTDFSSLPEWISMKAMVSTWLAGAIMYELWVGSDGTSARTIYHSGLPWLIGKALLMKQVHVVKQRLGITKENAERREAEIYKRAKIAYGALDRFRQFPIPDISKHTCCSSLVSLPTNRSQRNMLAGGAAIALRYLDHLGYNMQLHH